MAYELQNSAIAFYTFEMMHNALLANPDFGFLICAIYVSEVQRQPVQKPEF
jgi:hypothetical protein